MFEHRSAPLLPFRTFLLRRVTRSLVIVGIVVFFGLGTGILGYHFTENLSWLDALLNASMILSGMGPVNELHTTAGKLFASGFALFSGVAFISSIGILGTPFIHRMMHRFHLEEPGDDAQESETR